MQVGPYKLLVEVGRGGMGVVYRARSPEGTDVALKLIARRPGRAEALARFERERRLLASLGAEDGFVPLLDAGTAPGGEWLVMPFVAGGTLRDRIRRGPMPVDEALALGKRLARALGRAHEKGIVHRDLKPENVLFTAAGEPLLADLGLAKHFSSDAPGASQSVALTRDREIRGTPGYLAPEQARDARTAGPPSDVFALGAILYECLAGQEAFDGDSLIELVGKVERGNFMPLARRRPDAPRWLVKTVERCLAPAPDARFPDGAALARALEGESAGPTRGRARALLATGALATAVVAALAARHFARGLPEPRGLATTLVRPLAAATPGPSPAASPSPETPPPLPAVTAPFRASKRAELRAALGSYRWKHATAVRSAAFLPDGSAIVAGDASGVVRLWTTTTGEERACFPSRAGEVERLAVARDGKTALLACADRTVRWIDLATGEERGRFEGHEGPLTAVGFHPGGAQAVTASEDGTVRVWDLASHAEVFRTFTAATPRALAIAPGTERVVVGMDDGSIGSWGFTFGEHSDKVPAHQGEVGAVALDRDGKRALTGGADGRLKLWDLEAIARGAGVAAELGSALATRAPVSAVAWAPGRRAVSGSLDGTVTLWTTDPLRSLRTFPARVGAVREVGVSPDGRFVLAAGDAQRVQVFELATGSEVAPAEGHGSEVDALAVSPDGTRLASGSRDRTLRLWDTSALARGGPPVVKPLRILEGHRGAVADVSFTPDGTRVVSGSWDGTVGVWDAASGASLFDLDPGHGSVETASLSPDGTRVLTGQWDGTVGVSGLATGASGRFVIAHGKGRTVATFAPDGRGWASAGTDGLLRLWSAAGEPVRTFTGAQGWIGAIAFSPDGARIFEGGLDQKVRSGDARGREPSVACDAGAAVVALAVRPGGRELFAAAGSWVELIDAPKGQVEERLDLAPAGDGPTSLALWPGGHWLAVGTARGIVLLYELR